MLDNRVLDLGHVVSLNAERWPRHLALVDGRGSRRTHGELDQRTNRLAHALLGLGLRTGDRIGCWMDDIVEHVELYVAAAKAGITMVPVNKLLTPDEASFQLRQTGARALVYTPELAERVDALETDQPLILIAAGVGRQRGPGHPFEEVLGEASVSALGRPDPDAPFMICFTSGTTGRPKGAVLTHRSVLSLATTQLTALRIPVCGVDLHVVSLSFPATIPTHTVSHLLAGGTDVLYGRTWDSDEVFYLIDRERVTQMYVPGPVVPEFTAEAEARPDRWRTLNSVLYAGSRGDPVALERLAAVIGTRYVQGWGMSENSGGLAVATAPNDVIHPPADFFSKAGRALPGTRVIAVDDQRRPVPSGVDGELAVKSPSLFAGYWDDADATAKVLQDGWYYTGDMGSIDEDGYVSISDRRTNLIVSGGMNIYPAEIELVLDQIPEIKEVAVVGGPHPRWGQTPIAVVVPQHGAQLSEEQVVAFARTRLASYKKPTSVVFVDSIPRTAGGKVARGVLRDRLGFSAGSA